MTDLDRVFENLEPAPGGWIRLRARIGAAPPRRFSPWVLVPLAAAAVALLVARTPSPPLAPLGSDSAVMALLGQDLSAPVVSAAPDRVAVQRVSVDDQVVFFRVGALAANPPDHRSFLPLPR
ncbi:MAG: hypothetical protein GXP62_13585 [Oligoflexia bacterium]|nr:hypothetical protein [Oligoflexia bacterium]